MRQKLFWSSIAVLAAMALLRPMPIRATENGCPEGCTCVCSCPETDPAGVGGFDDSASSVPTAEVAETDETIETTETDGTVETTETDGTVETEPLPGNPVISEVMPDPEGNDADGEFIELLNLGPGKADLDGWKIRIGSKSFGLSGTVMGADTYRYWIYAETKLYLSNSGQTVELIDGAGQTVRSLTYPKAETGQSYARNAAGTYEWTTVSTPGATNIFMTEHPESEVSSPTVIPEGNDDPQNDPETENDIPPDQAECAECQDGARADIAVSEFLPDPEGSDDGEWIELANRSGFPADLTGWKLDDAEGGSKPFNLGGLTVPADGLLLIAKSESGLALNNGGDEVRLLLPDGSLADSVSYQAAPVGRSFARIGDGWAWTDQPSPGTANPEPDGEADGTGGTGGPDPDDEGSAEGGTVEEGEGFEETEEILSLSELPDLENGTLVTAQGTVSLPLGILGKTVLMIEDQADGAGAEARLYGPERPEMMFGQHVTVTGRISRSDGGWRINVVKGGLETSEAQTPPVPMETGLGEIGPEHNGMTVSVIGTVTSKGGRLLHLTDRSGEPQVTARLMGKDPVPGKAGDEVEVTGVIRWRNGKAELVIPERGGLKIIVPEPSPSESAASPISQSDTYRPLSDIGRKGLAGWPLALAVAMGTGIAAMGLMSRRKKPEPSQ
ncbi:lamin tail domain-containing protein [Candidatus Uhrbacteria bacterium]|nr:lamin tail domain-containing protein [Candidatus Uhrbacteria bacterium]